MSQRIALIDHDWWNRFVWLDLESGGVEVARGKPAEAKCLFHGFAHRYSRPLRPQKWACVYARQGAKLLQCGRRKWRLSDQAVNFRHTLKWGSFIRIFEVVTAQGVEFRHVYFPIGLAYFLDSDNEMSDFFLWASKYSKDPRWLEPNSWEKGFQWPPARSSK